jgi:hypothetical protein
MEKPSNEVMAIICSLVSNAMQENDQWYESILNHEYTPEMQFCNKLMEDLKLVDEWINKVESE